MIFGKCKIDKDGNLLFKKHGMANWCYMKCSQTKKDKCSYLTCPHFRLAPSGCHFRLQLCHSSHKIDMKDFVFEVGNGQ